jgi:hypothetical protein
MSAASPHEEEITRVSVDALLEILEPIKRDADLSLGRLLEGIRVSRDNQNCLPSGVMSYGRFIVFRDAILAIGSFDGFANPKLG